MTAEELLKTLDQQEEVQEYCIIDASTRLINVPPKFQMLGVESDEKAERIYFQCPKIVGDGLDLTTLALRINYQNAGNEKDQYIVEDVQVSGEDITFSWLLSRKVTKYKGKVQFILCAVKTDDEKITNEWNTTLATSEVLEGLEVDAEVTDEEQDVIKQLIALSNQAIVDCKNSTDKANAAASNANGAAQEAKNVAEDARDVIEQIQKESYMHTALQSFVNEVTATPTAYGNALVEKLEGYIRQDGTPSPKSPIHVSGMGDMGFWNGELMTGVWLDADGSYSFNAEYLCTKNMIPIKNGDVIELVIEKTVKRSKFSLYNSSGQFLQSVEDYGDNKQYLTYTVANENPKFFHISIQRDGDIEPNQICVRINGKYAVCVKANGINLFSTSLSKNNSNANAIIINSNTVKIQSTGNATSPGAFFNLGQYSNFAGKKIYMKFQKLEKTDGYIPKMSLRSTTGNSTTVKEIGFVLKEQSWAELSIPSDGGEADTLTLALYAHNGSSETSTSVSATFEGIIVSLSKQDFYPYQSNTTYIPVNYPLFDGDKIYNLNREYKILRKHGILLFDGSEDEKLAKSSSNALTYYMLDVPNVKSGGKVYCNWLKHGGSGNRPSVFIGKDLNLYLADGDLEEDTLEALKNKVKETPLMVVYELETPTEETLSSEALKSLYNIMSCDEQTKISIAGVPADAEIQNQFLLPRNVDGALNTTAYATAKRTEIEAEQQKQEMQKRLAALEQLSIKDA